MYLPGLTASCILSFVLLSAAMPAKHTSLGGRSGPLQTDADLIALSPILEFDNQHQTDPSHLILTRRSVPAIPVGNNWFMYFEQHMWAAPIQPAVEKMLVFYNALQAEAAARADQNTVSALTQFGKGNLRLEILCEGTLPWFFIGSFAEWMLHVTNRGFAGLYTARVVHAATGVTVTITLHLLAAAAVGN